VLVEGVGEIDQFLQINHFRGETNSGDAEYTIATQSPSFRDIHPNRSQEHSRVAIMDKEQAPFARRLEGMLAAVVRSAVSGARRRDSLTVLEDQHFVSLSARPRTRPRYALR